MSVGPFIDMAAARSGTVIDDNRDRRSGDRRHDDRPSSRPGRSDSTERFTDLADELLSREFDRSPVLASRLGLTDHDERLDDLSAEAFERRDAEDAELLARVEAIGEARPPGAGDLDAAGLVDRELVVAVLRGRAIVADRQVWRRDPQIYTDPITGGLFGLFLHRLRSDRDLVDAAVARLGQVGRVVDQGMANLDPTLAHPLIVSRSAGAARGASRYVRELLGAEVPPGPDRERLLAAGHRAGRELDRWVSFLDELARRATGSWQLGEERYTRLLREREVLADDARSLRERGRAEFDRLDAEMRSLARSISGSDDYRAVLAEANRDHPATEDAMRQAYESWTARARSFLDVTGLVTLPPGEACAVVPSPVFRRPVLGVASYESPPAFSDSWLGHFFVPFAPDGASPAEIAQRLSGNSHGGIPSVAVHETYPGHHWHLVMRKRNPSRLRRVFGTPYFNEGWALYAERMMRERGFFEEPLHELFQLNHTIFRAARVVVDIGLHIGELTVDQAIEIMRRDASLPEPTARAEVGRYCAWPTQASAYLTGCLEILRIRDRYLERLGAADARTAPVEVLRGFHDALTSSGSLPLGLAERAVLAGVPTGAPDEAEA